MNTIEKGLSQSIPAGTAPVPGERSVAQNVQTERSTTCKVLAVDDDELVRETFVEALTTCGFACTAAGSAREALELVRTAGPPVSFDLILVDIMMPEMDGLELVRRIRASGSDAAVLMVTVVDDLARVREALRLGADDYLVKPFALAQLRLACEKALERRRLLRELRLAELARFELVNLILHDLRNPLSVTRGYLSLMRSAPPAEGFAAGPGAGWERDIAAAADACDMAIGMIEQIGELNLLGESSITVNLEPVDVAALARAEVERCRPSAARSRKSLRFVSAQGDAPLYALADQRLLRRVVRDLICEGAKHASGRSDVLVETAASADGSEVTVAVADDGLSVPHPLREALFDKVRQGELRQLRVRRGAGLVLPFAREVCTKMGGRIWVEDALPARSESDPGRLGCRFVVALPAWREPA